MIHFLKKWGSRYRGELIFSLASYTTPIVGLWASVLTAKFLLPQELGSIQAIMLILPYAAFLHLGVINGLNRNLAFYIGRNDRATAQRMVNATAFVVNIISGIGLLLGCIILGIKFYSTPKNQIEIYASIALLSSLIFIHQGYYLNSLFCGGQQFHQLGKLTFIENGIRFLYSLLPAAFGWVGRIIGETIRPMIGFALRYKYRPYKPDKSGFSSQDIKLLLHAGTPLLITGYLYVLFLVADQSLIALHFDKIQLGYYSLSRLIITALMIVPTTIGTMLYPKASALYGQTGNPHALKPFFWKALLFNAVVFIPICCIAYFLLEPIVRMFLPHYVAGLEAAKINILTSITLISMGPSVIAGVLKKMIPVLFFYTIAIGIIWGVGQYLCVNQTPTIEMIAWLRFFVATGLSIVIIGYNYYLTTKDSE